jgi:hypothetical protein
MIINGHSAFETSNIELQTSKLIPYFCPKPITMDVSTISLIVSIVAFLAAFYAVFMLNELKSTPVKSESSNETRPLQLQAYERLVMLAERIGLPNLVSRANQQFAGSAGEMRGLLLESIKQEYDYNATQQIYVSPVAWEALRNLKEQNMLIINQVAGSMPTGATGFDLNKRLMEFAMTDKKGAMHQIVLEALNYEAKKIMK